MGFLIYTLKRKKVQIVGELRMRKNIISDEKNEFMP